MARLRATHQRARRRLKSATATWIRYLTWTMSLSELEEVRAELLESQRALMATRHELLKAQVVAATRQDTLRLLAAAIYGGRALDPVLLTEMVLTPDQLSAVRIELRALATHLRKRAAEIDALVDACE